MNATEWAVRVSLVRWDGTGSRLGCGMLLRRRQREEVRGAPKALRRIRNLLKELIIDSSVKRRAMRSAPENTKFVSKRSDKRGL